MNHKSIKKHNINAHFKKSAHTYFFINPILIKYCLAICLFIQANIFGQATENILNKEDQLLNYLITLQFSQKLLPLKNDNLMKIHVIETVKHAFDLKQINPPTENSPDDYSFFFRFTQMPLEIRKSVYRLLIPEKNYFLTFENVETDISKLAFQYEGLYTIYPGFPFNLNLTDKTECQCFNGYSTNNIIHYKECTKSSIPFDPKKFPISGTFLKKLLNPWSPLRSDDEDIIYEHLFGNSSQKSYYLISPFINSSTQSKDIIFYLPFLYGKSLAMLSSDKPHGKEFRFEHPIISAHMLDQDHLLIECIDENICRDFYGKLRHDNTKPIPINHFFALYSISMLKEIECHDNQPVNISVAQALYKKKLFLQHCLYNNYIIGSAEGPEVWTVAFTLNKKMYIKQKNKEDNAQEKFLVFNIHDDLESVLSLTNNPEKIN